MAGFGPGRNGGRPYQFTEEQITVALLAVIAHAGNASAASRYLRAEKGFDVTSGTLSKWTTQYGARYDELRQEHRGEMEARLGHDMIQVAGLALEGQREAVTLARKRLKTGEDLDPGRTAANLARVSQSNVDKNRTLTDRPIQVTEGRGAEELIRSLAKMGVVRIPEQIERSGLWFQSDGCDRRPGE